MTQLSIDFTPLARRTDPSTSHDAAAATESFRANHEARIFGALHEAGDRGMTYREIAAVTGMEPVAVARRLSSMGKRHLIERRKKPGSTKPRDYLERDGMAIWWRT